VAGDEHRHELVAQLGVGHRAAVLVARVQQHRQQVVARAGPRVALGDGRELRAALGDLGVDQRVDARPLAAVRAPRAAGTEVDPRQPRRVAGGDRQRQVEQRRQQAAQLVAAGRVAHAEDDLEDHVHRDPVHDRAGRDRRVRGPGGDVLQCALAREPLPARQPPAVQRPEDDSAQPQVLGLVEHDHRARSRRLLEQPVGLARVRDLGRQSQQPARGRQRREDDDLALVEEQPADAEGGPVAHRVAIEEGVLVQRPVEHLERRRHRRAGQMIDGLDRRCSHSQTVPAGAWRRAGPRP
jgi:hypothetical protein